MALSFADPFLRSHLEVRLYAILCVSGCVALLWCQERAIAAQILVLLRKAARSKFHRRDYRNSIDCGQDNWHDDGDVLLLFTCNGR